MPRTYDLLGKKFGRLRVLRRVKNTQHGASVWEVRCACGVVKTVRGDMLVRGVAVSCGCYARALARVRSTTHGMSRTPEYKSWVSMWTRCTDPKHPAYARYGGAGINVCARWRRFENFIADMGRCPFAHGSVERHKNNRGYTPRNCCWLPRGEQSKNRKNVRRIDGMTIPDLAAAKGIKTTTLHRRIKAGWPQSKWFKTPIELGTRRAR